MTKDPVIDRRVARTRDALGQALTALITRKGYAEVTVDEICAEANIGRSTFYAHFPNKDALKRHGIDLHLARGLRERQESAYHGDSGAPAAEFAFVLGLIEHAREQRHLYRALVSMGGSDVTLAMIREIVVDLTRRELTAQGRFADDPAGRQVAVAFVSGALIAVLTGWLDDGAKLPPDRLDALFRSLVMQGLSGDGNGQGDAA